MQNSQTQPVLWLSCIIAAKTIEDLCFFFLIMELNHTKQEAFQWVRSRLPINRHHNETLAS